MQLFDGQVIARGGSQSGPFYCRPTRVVLSRHGFMQTHLWAFGGRDMVMATLAWNAERMSPVSMSAVEVARAAIASARECETALGGAVLLLGAAAISTEHRARGLIILLGSYVAASIAFNVALFRMPGAGAAYLHSALPAFAILAGSGSARLIALASSASTRILLIATALAIHIAGSPMWPYQRPRAEWLADRRRIHRGERSRYCRCVGGDGGHRVLFGPSGSSAGKYPSRGNWSSSRSKAGLQRTSHS